MLVIIGKTQKLKIFRRQVWWPWRPTYEPN